MTRTPAHPDTISDLAPDCRRVLREEYQRIQIAADRDRLIDPEADDERVYQFGKRRRVERRLRTTSEIARDVAAAVAEYHRTAETWGVTS